MNWEATGAIGEIIGAAAVVISLVYLASQIRISNRASKQATEQHMLDNVRIWLGRISDSDTLSAIWMRGCRDDPELSEEEWSRLRRLTNCLDESIHIVTLINSITVAKVKVFIEAYHVSTGRSTSFVASENGGV